MAVAERPASGINIYNVSAPACTMREIVDGIAGALGRHPYSCAGSGVAGFVSKSASVQDTEPSHGGPPSNCEKMVG
jgi:nucleoside-diphosphate-sugar epimerase